MDTGHRRVLAISTIKTTFQDGVKCGKSAADTIAVESVQVLHLFSKGNKQNLNGRFGFCMPC